MAIKYIHPPTQETTERYSWWWVAVYKDQSSLEQFEIRDNQPIFHRFAEINQDQLQHLELRHNTVPAIKVSIPADADPECFMRNFILENDTARKRFYFIGFKRGKTRWLVGIDNKNEVYLVDDPDLIAPPNLN